VRKGKIQLGIQFAIERHGGEPLAMQIARQLEVAIDRGHVRPGVRLPSSRSLARALGVSRNTVLIAYDELTSRGLVRSRRGAGMYASAPAVLPSLDLKRIMREAQYPAQMIEFSDVDGNRIYVT
jgi:GntR family transcriptional regulator/MocR family aminotransferase